MRMAKRQGYSMTSQVRVGAAVFIGKDGRFVMLRRRGDHGGGTWGLPGGHLEFGESWEECVRRETLEETGLEIANVRFVAATNDIFKDTGKHYVTIFMRADYADGEATIMEPEKCDALDWFTYESMPENVFLPIITLRQTYPDTVN